MLTASQVLALCCGAQLTAIRWADGLPLAVGRASRTEPPGLRRALEARDRTCRWTGCDTPGAWCTGHHINSLRNGARTSLSEEALLCYVHHSYFIHQLGWTVSGDANGTLRFTSPDGQITLESPVARVRRSPGCINGSQAVPVLGLAQAVRLMVQKPAREFAACASPGFANPQTRLRHREDAS
jgi:hypothetical protein